MGTPLLEMFLAKFLKVENPYQIKLITRFIVFTFIAFFCFCFAKTSFQEAAWK